MRKLLLRGLRARTRRLIGTFVAKYATRMVDSVLTGRTEGTKVP